MPFPNVSYCLVCDGLRPEIGGKLTILGFFGVTPNVEIVVINQALPLNLAFVMGFPPVQEVRQYSAMLTINKPNGGAAFQSPPIALQVLAGRGGIFGTGAILSPPHAIGVHSINLTVNNEPKFHSSFSIRLPNAAELAQLGISAAVPPREIN
jgi:hypothetical protein